MLFEVYLNKSVIKIIKAECATLLKSLQWLPSSFRVEYKVLA